MFFQESYQETRDLHQMSKHVEKLQQITSWSGEHQNHVTELQYDDVTKLIECINKLLAVARERPYNWQRHCEVSTETLDFLLFVSLNLEEVVAHVSMELLLVATECGGDDKKKKKLLEREKKLNGFLLDEGMAGEGLEDFLRHFLLQMNSSKLRWKAHQLALNMFRYQ